MNTKAKKISPNKQYETKIKFKKKPKIELKEN